MICHVLDLSLGHSIDDEGCIPYILTVQVEHCNELAHHLSIFVINNIYNVAFPTIWILMLLVYANGC